MQAAIGTPGTVGKYGSGNLLITPAEIATEALMRLEDALVLPKLIDRQFQPYFSDRIGDTITYKKPFYAKSSSGRTIQTSDYQPLVDQYGTLKITEWEKVPFQWNSQELMEAIEDLGSRYLASGVQALSHAYDESVGVTLGNALFRIEGTAGTAITEASHPKVLAHAEDTSIPMYGRFGIMEPRDLELMNVRLQKVQASGDLQKEAIERFHVGPYSTFDVYMSTNLGRMKTAKPASGIGSPKVNMTGGYEGSELPTDGWHASKQTVLLKGQLIQIGTETAGGVYETAMLGKERRSTGRLMTFTVTEDVVTSAAGAATIKISPPLNAGTLTDSDPDGSGTVSLAAFQNVSKKAPDNAVITILGGSTGKTYRQSVFCTKMVATLANVAIIPPASAVAAGNAGMQWDPDTGLSIAILRDYGFADYGETYRMDARWGVAACYPEQGVRLLSEEVKG